LHISRKWGIQTNEEGCIPLPQQIIHGQNL
jgi:hypothetical protein